MQVLRKPEAVWGVRSSLSLSTCYLHWRPDSLVAASGRLVAWVCGSDASEWPDWSDKDPSLTPEL